MRGVATAAGAIFLEFQPLGVIFLILEGGIVSLLTLRAGQMYNCPGFRFLSHFILFYYFGKHARPYGAAAFPNGKAQAFL